MYKDRGQYTFSINTYIHSIRKPMEKQNCHKNCKRLKFINSDNIKHNCLQFLKKARNHNHKKYNIVLGTF